MSTTNDETCILCVEQEAARLLSLSLDLGLEPETREDIVNLIVLSGQAYLCEDPAFAEEVINAVLEMA